MSRPRTRPTREQTKDRLMRAAARVFASKGIGDASIEDICDEAGFSRGAFYSNFSRKDDLVLELLEAHIEGSSAEMERVWAASSDATDFIANIESERDTRSGPLDIEDGGVLYVELLLFALRNRENRASLVAHHRRQRESNRRVLEQIVASIGRDYPAPYDDVVSIIMAIDIGLHLNALVDPESYRENQFSEIMGLLHRLWLAAPEDAVVGQEPTGGHG